MAWLFIDTSRMAAARVGSVDGTRVQIRTITGRSERVVRSILQRANAMSTASALDGILVVSGPGSFSAIRAGVVTANVLARCHRVPLVAITAMEAQDRATLIARCDASFAVDRVMPTYDQEPNISSV